MNLLKNIANSTSKIPKEYRESKTIDEIKNDLLELEEISNPHILNLRSLLFPSDKLVTQIEFSGKKHTMDLEISDDSHSYIANGIPVHNTINLPSDYSYEDFKNVYLKAFDTGVIKGVTTYRAGTMASVMKTDKKESQLNILDLSKRNGHIIRHAAPIRPKSVPCDVHQITSGGVKWYVFVGMVVDQNENFSPYEVFAFKKKNISFNVKSLHGVLTKVKRGRYDFESDKGIVLEDLASLFERDEQEALTRMISTSLRHGVEIKFIVEQLNKAEGDISVFSKAVGRCLKKYIPDNETPSDDKDCDGCGAKDSMIYIEGCVKCKHCGWSKC